MEESNQEGYQELGWIINKSEEGIFLVIASEGMQKEIISTYRHGLVQIYDYKKIQYHIPLTALAYGLIILKKQKFL